MNVNINYHQCYEKPCHFLFALMSHAACVHSSEMKSCRKRVRSPTGSQPPQPYGSTVRNYFWLLFCFFPEYICLWFYCLFLSTAWVSSGQYLNLDKDHNGMLSKEELSRYGTATLTSVFLDRVFQECLTYDGEMVRQMDSAADCPWFAILKIYVN